MAQKPSIPKGTRDFSPEEMIRRNYIFNTIQKVFKTHGYLPIETPAMENLSTLLGKYGEEGDRLLYKILNSGDFLAKSEDSQLLERNAARLALLFSEKGLRYDLTVPFARYVVQNRNDIVFPFKRYQIQPVWRADRPQKGRYREFYQCDVDVIGSNSLLNEAELIQIADRVFTSLGIQTVIKLNNRKILAGIAEIIGELERIVDITVAIDKLEKIGLDNVNKELSEKGISDQAISQLQPIILLEGNKTEKIAKLRQILRESAIGMSGLDEMEQVFAYFDTLEIESTLELDLTLARGLNYYTGAIIEVKARDVAIGSICGGGRYDDLTGIFGLPDVSGVGISFGADRIYDVMKELALFPEETASSTSVMFVNFGKKEEKYCLPILSRLQEHGISSELYPDAAKMKKQMNYANRKHIPYVVLVGENEMKEGKVTLKDMQSGEQVMLGVHELMERVG